LGRIQESDRHEEGGGSGHEKGRLFLGQPGRQERKGFGADGQQKRAASRRHKGMENKQWVRGEGTSQRQVTRNCETGGGRKVQLRKAVPPHPWFQ